MTSETHKALEARNALIEMYAALNDSAKWCENVRVVGEALTRLSELEPIIQELVEARKKATPGEWEDVTITNYEVVSGSIRINEKETADTLKLKSTFKDDLDRRCTVFISELLATAGRSGELRGNAAFIALAANRVAKIGGVDA